MDGTTLTAWRTACASALAASYLAREDAAHLVMIGAGALAPHLVRAHASVRPIRRVTLWNRTRERAVQTAFALAVGGLEVEVTDDLEAAVREADIVSCATLSADAAGARQVAEEGRACRPGRRPIRRRCARPTTTRSRRRASMSTPAPAPLKEAGDIVQPLKSGVLKKDGVRGDLFELCRGEAKGRTGERRSRCSSRSAPRSRIWPPRCWCGAPAVRRSDQIDEFKFGFEYHKYLMYLIRPIASSDRVSLWIL